MFLNSSKSACISAVGKNLDNSNNNFRFSFCRISSSFSSFVIAKIFYINTDLFDFTKVIILESFCNNPRILQDVKLALELGDVANALSLSYIAKEYFGKSKTWLYQRLNGNKVNGKPARFTEDERKRFAAALLDLSKRINETALKFV